MDPITAFIIFTVSIIVLIISSSYFLGSVRGLGKVMGISPFVVGAFIVAFGTSLPEATIAIFSAFNGLVDIPVAQTIGSNIANILLVLGISTIVIKKMSITKNLIDIAFPIIATVTLLFVFILQDGVVGFYEGLFLLVGFVFYVIYIFSEEDNRSVTSTPKEKFHEISRLPKNIGVFFITIILIAVSSYFTVSATEDIALFFGVPEAIIAVTVIALGTSLPELVVSIQAILKKEVELVVGNILGSNVFNILFVIGIPALITDLTVDSVTYTIGIPVLIGATALFIISGISNKIHIWEGLLFILIYGLFLTKITGII